MGQGASAKDSTEWQVLSLWTGPLASAPPHTLSELYLLMVAKPFSCSLPHTFSFPFSL